MPLDLLIKTSWAIYRRNNIIRMLSPIIGIVTALNMVVPTGDEKNYLLACGFGCFSILLGLFMLFIETGLIQTTYNDQLGKVTTLSDLWMIFCSRFGSLILASFVFAIVAGGGFFLLVLILIFGLLGPGKLVDINSKFFVIILSMAIYAIPLTLMIQFAYRAILIEPNGGLSSSSRGLHVLLKNLGKVLIITLFYFVIEVPLPVIASIAYVAIVEPSNIGIAVNAGFYSFIKAFWLSPVARIGIVFISPVLLPLYSITLTLLYLDSTRRDSVQAEQAQPALP